MILILISSLKKPTSYLIVDSNSFPFAGFVGLTSYVLKHVISQFMRDHEKVHLQAAYRILGYLKGSPERGILFKRSNELVFEA